MALEKNTCKTVDCLNKLHNMTPPDKDSVCLLHVGNLFSEPEVAVIYKY